MCGIVGVIPRQKNGFTAVQQRMFYQMLFANELRGIDATGVITVHTTGDFGIMKEANAAYYFNDQFIDSDLDKDLYKNGCAVIGHNRAKTVGDNKDLNAHPFVVDKTFAMVHNGTLRNHLELEKLDGIGQTEVDSEALTRVFAQAMDQEDWKTSMQDALGRVKGAFACVWYDQKRHQVCMIRNSERPLGLAMTKQSVLFASELGLAGWIASRNGEGVEEFKSLAVHTLYTFDMKEGQGAFQETFLSPRYFPTSTKGYNNGTTHTTTGSHAQQTDGSQTPSTGKTGTPPSIEGQGELSKSGFKRLRAAIFRKEIEFLQEDYVESSAGQFLVMGRSVNGAHDLCEVRHNISGVLDGKKLGITEYDFYGKEMICKGIVADVEYDKDHKSAIITVEALSIKDEHAQVFH